MINTLIAHLLPSIQHFQIGGYWIAFFSALLETIIGVGFFFPGSTIILVLGAFCARGYLDLGDLIWFAVIGAVLGDNINFYLGQKYGVKWMEKGFWFLKSDHIEKTRRFMNDNGAKSVFLGRFIPSVKEVVPFFAGSVGMNKKSFMIWNILGAVGWGFQWILAGYLFSQSLKLAQFWLSGAALFFTFLLVMVGIFTFFKWMVIRNGKQILMFAGSLLESVKTAVLDNEHVAMWIHKHPKSISFLKARLDREAFSGLTLSIFIISFVYVFALFAGIVEDVITSAPIVAADIRTANLMAGFRTVTLTRVFTFITLLGKSQVILGFILVLVVLLYLWRKKDYIMSLFVSISGSTAFTYLGKLAFHRPRPQLGVYAEHTFSFPSGHATIAVAFYGFIGYLLIRSAQTWKKKVNLFFATILTIAAIGLSRIYLGEHYISDVWCGYLVGTMWLIIAAAFLEWRSYQAVKNRPVSPAGNARPLTFVLVLAALLFYIGFSIHYNPPRASVPPKAFAVIATGTDIFKNETMKYTQTLIGEKQEPVNFIFIAKNDQQLTAALQQAGWRSAGRQNFSSFLKLAEILILKKQLPSMPVSPFFWNTRIQDFSFSKVSGKKGLNHAHHLRIWRTNTVLKNGNAVYVGMASANKGLKWNIIPKISPDLDAERNALYQELNHAGKIKKSQKIQLVKPLVGENFTGDSFFSNGNAYIVSIQ